MSKFLSVEFQGPYQSILNFFDSKGWKFEIKHIGSTKLLMKVPADCVDDIKFFENTPVDDKNEDRKDDKMTLIRPVSESEYTNTAENGFELIHAQTNERLASEGNEPIISSNVIKHQDTTHHGTANEQGFPTPLVEVAQKQVVKQSEEIMDPKENIAVAFSDAILLSKSPLPRDDAFSYLTSKRYLRNFIVTSTLVLFFLTLLD